MDLKMLVTVFASVFLAELGDKTQLATVLFAADNAIDKLTVFVAASAALVLTTALGVLVGGAVSSILDPTKMKYIAGAGFVLIGVWTMWRA